MTTLALTLPPRRERSAEGTRRRILDAAEIEFAAKGFDGARLVTIARAAEAQQALIHHYFEDKAGLYRAVIARALESLSSEGWDILGKVRGSIPPPPPPPPKGRARARKASADPPAQSGVKIAALVDAFVASMLRFYSTHTRILAILRHEAHGGGELANEVVKESVKPVFDAVVALVDDLRARGEVRADVDARHVCISAVSMASWPFQEERFLSMVFPMDVHDPRFFEERRREIVATILGRVLPPRQRAATDGMRSGSGRCVIVTGPGLALRGAISVASPAHGLCGANPTRPPARSVITRLERSTGAPMSDAMGKLWLCAWETSALHQPAPG